MDLFARRFSRWSCILVRAAEQLHAQRQQRSTVAVGQEAEVADAHEARWQQMEQKASQELIYAQSHEALLVAMRGIAPAEGDVAIGESYQPGVRDGDAMRVGAEITQHMFRSAEGLLGVDDPVVAEQRPQPRREGAWL